MPIINWLISIKKEKCLMDAVEIYKILGIIATALAAGFAIKIVISRKNSSKKETRIISQKNNIAGGDIVAGNSTKTNNK